MTSVHLPPFSTKLEKFKSWKTISLTTERGWLGGYLYRRFRFNVPLFEMVHLNPSSFLSTPETHPLTGGAPLSRLSYVFNQTNWLHPTIRLSDPGHSEGYGRFVVDTNSPPQTSRSGWTTTTLTHTSRLPSWPTRPRVRTTRRHVSEKVPTLCVPVEIPVPPLSPLRGVFFGEEEKGG